MFIDHTGHPTYQCDGDLEHYTSGGYVEKGVRTLHDQRPGSGPDQ